MFTGLVADVGEVLDVEKSPDGVRLRVASRLVADVEEGDSICVNGVCLTATDVCDAAFSADVMNETLRLTSLAAVRPGAAVNLELAMSPADRFGGHIVQGHVDGVGVVAGVDADGFSKRVRVEAPPDVLRYIIRKGSVTVDGVSLTVADLDDRSFTVSLIPETLNRTSLGSAAPGLTLNLEVDVLAKYVERAVRR